MTIYEELKDYLNNEIGRIISTAEIKDALKEKYSRNPSSVIPSDYCYNRVNDGIKFKKHIFHYIDRNNYKYLGERYAYTGKIYHKPATHKNEFVVGEWINGRINIYDNPIDSISGEPIQVWTGKTISKRPVKSPPTKPIREEDIVEPRKLFQSVEQIRALISRADDIFETRNLIAKFSELKEERVPFFLNYDDFNAILSWKLRHQYNRTAKHRKLNTDFNIRTITQAAFSIEHHDKNFETELRLKILTTLSGVEVPVASAIMTLCHPEKYAVIDFRVWRQIFGEIKKYQNYTTKDYIRYLSIIEGLAITFGVTLQEIDMAIWKYDIETHKKGFSETN